MSDGEGFLQRWSKRKLGEKPPVAPGPETENAIAAPVSGETQEPAGLPEPFDLSTLPSLDDLTGDSDLTAFLQKGVPESLKNAAMRRIWALDPLIKDATGPVDYAWDFNDPNSMPGFGPLSADTDVAALLRHVMGEKEPAVEEIAESGAGDALAVVADVEGESATGDAGSELPGAEAGPMIGQAETRPLEQQPLAEPDRSLPQETKLSEIPASKEEYFAIRKRHGGALPG